MMQLVRSVALPTDQFLGCYRSSVNTRCDAKEAAVLLCFSDEAELDDTQQDGNRMRKCLGFLTKNVPWVSGKSTVHELLECSKITF
jgi:hypothetical protein